MKQEKRISEKKVRFLRRAPFVLGSLLFGLSAPASGESLPYGLVLGGTGQMAGSSNITNEAVEHAFGPDVAERRVEYLDRFYRHVAGGRARPLAEMLPVDMSWHMIGFCEDMVPFAGLYSGRSEILRLFDAYFAAVRIREYHFQYRLVDGDYVSWHSRLVADVPSTGKTFDAEFTHVWQFDGGRPVFCRSYYDTQLQVEAFTAGGPSWLMDRQNLNDDFE